MRDKISIIIPVFNAELYLKQCLDSVLKQTYSNLEIILINDGSTDGSGVICDEYAKKDRRIKVIHQNNQGVSVSRNEGIKVATGRYLTFVDADDFITEHMYEILIDSISKHRVDLVMCNYFRFYQDYQKICCCEFNYYGLYNRQQIYQELVLPMIGSDLEHLSCPTLIGSNWRCLYRLDLIHDNQLLFKEFKIAEDMIFHLEYLMLINSAYVVEECLYFYRYNELSATINYKKNLFDKSVAQTAVIESILKKYNKFNKNAKERLISRRLYFLCWSLTNELHPKNEVTYKQRKQNVNKYLKSYEAKEVFRWRYIMKMNKKEFLIWGILKLRFYGLFYYYHQHKQLE